MRWLFVVSIGLSACKGNPPPPPAPAVGSAQPLPPEIEKGVQQVAADKQATAKAAKGTIQIARAWRYEGGPHVAADHSWVALDVDFGGQPIDTDDIEAVDPDSNSVSPIGDVKRLDENGALTSFSGAHGNETHFLLFFETEATTKRLSLRYWGETLSPRPIEIAASGPTFAGPSIAVIRHFVDGSRHVLLLEESNVDGTPSFIVDHLDEDGGECAGVAMIPVTRALAVAQPSLEPIIPHGFYLVEYACEKPPTKLVASGLPLTLPPSEKVSIPAPTLEALEGRGPDITIVPAREVFTVVAARPDGSMIAIAPDKGMVRLIDPQGKETARLPGLGNGEVSAMQFTPDGSHLWIVQQSGEVIVWEIPSGKQVAKRMITPAADIYAHPFATPDGKLLVLDHPWYDADDTMVAWSGQITVLSLPDLAPKKVIRIVKGDDGSIKDAIPSPDGKRLIVCATSDAGPTVRVYGVPKADLQVTVKTDKDRVIAACILTADGRIVLGGEDGQISIYDRAGKPSATVLGHQGGVSTLEARADGAFLSGGADGKVLLWPKNSTKPQLLMQHRDPALGVHAWKDLVISDAHDDVYVSDGTKVLKRLYGTDGPNTIAVAPGFVAVSEMLIGQKSGRVRIWHLPKR